MPLAYGWDQFIGFDKLADDAAAGVQNLPDMPWFYSMFLAYAHVTFQLWAAASGASAAQQAQIFNLLNTSWASKVKQWTTRATIEAGVQRFMEEDLNPLVSALGTAFDGLQDRVSAEEAQNLIDQAIRPVLGRLDGIESKLTDLETQLAQLADPITGEVQLLRERISALEARPPGEPLTVEEQDVLSELVSIRSMTTSWEDWWDDMLHRWRSLPNETWIERIDGLLGLPEQRIGWFAMTLEMAVRNSGLTAEEFVQAALATAQLSIDFVRQFMMYAADAYPAGGELGNLTQYTAFARFCSLVQNFPGRHYTPPDLTHDWRPYVNDGGG